MLMVPPRQYIVVDPVSQEAAIIDSVLDYNPASGALSTTAADGLLAFVAEKKLKVVRILYVERLFDQMLRALTLLLVVKRTHMRTI